MTIDQLMRYFGSQANLAAELGISPNTVNNWIVREKIPWQRQLEIEQITEGKLRADSYMENRERA